MQEIIGRRLESGFVGRREELARFGENLALPAHDRRHRFLFNVWGDPGVGKTSLVAQLTQIAREHGALCTCVEHEVFDLPGVLDTIATQLSDQGVRLKGIEDRIHTYHRRRHELDADPRAPEGAALVLARIAMTVTRRAVRDMPLGRPPS